MLKKLFYLAILLLLVFLYSCGSCGSDEKKEKKAYVTGKLDKEEIITLAELIPEPGPLPEDIKNENIGVVSIIMRSDIITRSDFFKYSSMSDISGSLATINDNGEFTLDVPIGEEFFMFVVLTTGNSSFKFNGSSGETTALGIINSKTESGVESNIKLPDTYNDEIVDIGETLYSETYGSFVAKNSIYEKIDSDGDDILDFWDTDAFIPDSEELVILIDGDSDYNLDSTISEQADLTITLSEDVGAVEFNIFKKPDICTFTDNGNNTATFSCLSDSTGSYSGVIISAKYGNSLVNATIKITVKEAGGKITKIVAGLDHNCALFENGSIKCWGNNDAGQLGLGDIENRGDEEGEMGDKLPYVDLGENIIASDICVGIVHTCALTTDGKIKCWGGNDKGQLGQGDKTDRGNGENEMGDNLDFIDIVGTLTGISCGDQHTCVIINGPDLGAVQCWGDNSDGELGYGDTEKRGDGYDEMGVNLGAVKVGASKFVSLISAGSAHTCAILSDNSLKCWGKNSFGQLGLGLSTSTVGDGPNEMGNDLDSVDLGSDRFAVNISGGDANSCALLDDNSIKCWGDGSGGQLGTGDVQNIGSGSGSMGDNLLPIDLGANGGVVDVKVRGNHVCANFLDGKVKCWGMNALGQLGLADNSSRGDDSNEMGEELDFVDTGGSVKSTALGSGHICFLFEDDYVKCCGFNNKGQLGLGDTDTRCEETGETPTTLPIVDLGL